MVASRTLLGLSVQGLFLSLQSIRLSKPEPKSMTVAGSGVTVTGLAVIDNSPLLVLLGLDAVFCRSVCLGPLEWAHLLRTLHFVGLRFLQ